MKKSISFFILVLFQMSYTAMHAQEESAVQDMATLIKESKYIKEDTSGMKLLNNLASAFFHKNENDSCKKYASMTLRIADRLLNTQTVKNNKTFTLRCKIFKAEAIEIIGNAMYYENTRSAIDTFYAALMLRAESGSKEGMGDLYFSIAYLYYVLIDYNTADSIYQLSLKLFEETNDMRGMGMAYNWKAINQRDMGNYGDALESNVNALQIGRQISDSSVITDALLAMGFIYLKVKNYEEALKNQQAALAIFTANQDSVGIATVYNDMGVTNVTAGKLDKALNNHMAALYIRKQFKQYGDIAASYNYISNIFERQGKNKEALENCFEGLRYAKLNGDIRYISTAYISAGDIYSRMPDDTSALKNYYEALNIARNNKASSSEAEASEKIGLIYLKQGKTGEAIAFLRKAAAVVLPGDYFNLQNIYRNLSAAYDKVNDHKNAYQSHVKYKRFSDSASSIEKAEKLTNLTNQLAFENRQALLKASQDKMLAVKQSEIERQKIVRNISFAGLFIVVVFAVIFFMRFREKRKLNIALEQTLTNLKSTQSQLIQSEKMASLGELTAGIAHEIQNPLNFVNNFSEVSRDLLEEWRSERSKIKGEKDKEVENDIINDIALNLEKILYHGKRADSIVKGMMQHSRTTSGEKEMVDINTLADEYLRLAYHGMRGKDKSFNVTMKTGYDQSIGKINIAPQEIGRVLLNLYNNAFYAVNERKKQSQDGFEPTITISTKKLDNKIIISVKDNGNGIPQKVVDKIFQPFFTTKPTGSGTGLGLSLSYDIIKAHGGEINIRNKPGEGAEFIIALSVN